MKKRNSIFIAFSIGVALIALFLAFQLTPWFYAINTRVRLYLDAPAETKINICWDKSRNQCLPMVPFSKTKNRIAERGEIADLWMSELPPRPAYSISLIFESSAKKVVFHKLELDSSNVLLFGYHRGIGVINAQFDLDQFEQHDISYKLINGMNYIEYDKVGWLTLNRGISPGPSNFSSDGTGVFMVWGLLFFIYILMATLVYLLPNTIHNLSSAIEMVHFPKYPRWTYVVFGGAIGVMLLLVVNSGVIFNNADPLGYLYLALGGGWFNETRLPGYPLFLGLVLRLSHYDLDGIIFAQAVILDISVVICIWTLRKWISSYVAVLFVLLCLFSPAQIHWARWILRESLFTSLVLLGVTAAIAHFTSRKPFSGIWLIIFALICGAAFLVRENGMILPVVLLPVLVPEFFKRLLSSGTISERVQSILGLITLYSGPVVVIGTIYIAFSSYNYLNFGYFQLEFHQTSHAFLAKTIYTGNSDARGLLFKEYSNNPEVKPYLGRSLYTSYILARDQTPGDDPIYIALVPTITHKMLALHQAYNLFHLGNILNEIGKDMNNLVPWRAELAGALRQCREIISLDSNGWYPVQYSLQDMGIMTSRQELLDNYLIKVKKVRVDDKIIGTDSILAHYYATTQGYAWYGLILILALLSSIYILHSEDPVFLAPIVFFVANSVLLLITRLVSNRYLINLDVLLILQMALGFSLWMRRYSSVILSKKAV